MTVPQRSDTEQPDLYVLDFAPDRTSISLSGDVNSSRMRMLMEIIDITVNAGKPAQVHLRNTSFSDSAGYGFLLELLARTKPRAVRLVDTPPEIAQTLSRLRLGTMIEIVDATGGSPSGLA